MTLVGRSAEMEKIRQSFASGTRLLTLLGPAGVGKSRLAREYATALGVRAIYVPLDAVELDADLERAIAAKRPLLSSSAVLWLDGLERTVRRCAAMIESLLDELPALQVLATSQVAVGIEREQRLYVPPLGDDEAIELFLRTMERVAGPSVRGADRGLLERLVRRLDGLPLAIELAAGRTTVLSLDQLDRRLDDRFRLLSDEDGGQPARHHSLRAVLDAAWEMLDGLERSALAQCAVFAGSFTVEAAERVIALDGREVLDVLQHLRARSLIETTGELHRPGRLRLLESIRMFAAEQLERLGLREAAERRHAECFAGCDVTLEPDVEDAIGDPANLLAAFRRTREIDVALAARLLLAATPYLAIAGPPDDALAFFERLPVDEPRARASMLRAHSQQLRVLGRNGETIPLLLQALELAGDDELLRLCVLRELGVAHRETGDLSPALASLEEALQLARSIGDDRLLALILRNLGTLHRHAGRPMEARRHYEEALGRLQRARSPFVEAIINGNLGHLELGQKRWASAEGKYRDALAMLAGSGDARTEGLYWSRLSLAVLEQGRGEESAELSARAIETLASIRDDVTVAVVRAIRAWVLVRTKRDREATKMLVLLRASCAMLRGRAPAWHLEAAEAIAGGLEAMIAGAPVKTYLKPIHDDWRYLAEALTLTRSIAGEPVTVGRAGAFFRIGDRSVSLTRRGALRRVLWRLVEARLETPGDPLSVAALAEAGWPRERVQTMAAANRVYSAVATLRRMGWAGLLLREADGYLLSVDVPVRIAE